MRLNCAEFVPKALVAVTVNVAAPNVVGVPVMTPVVGFKLSPAGSEPAVIAQVIGALPDAPRV